VIAQKSDPSPPLTAALEAIRKQYDLPALAGARFARGSVAESAVAGVRKYGDATPATVKDAFHLGSCTKSMTATLVAMAIDERKLDYETTLSSLLPGEAAGMRPEYRDVTIRQLLNQRSGFSDNTWPPGSPSNWALAVGSLRAQRARYLSLALRDQPVSTLGTAFLYSNRNYIVAGAILEMLTGQPWETLIERRLFRPLGMASAGFGPMATPPDHVDAPWPHVLSGGVHVPIPPGPAADNPLVLGPAGTVHSSLDDWARYGLFHLRSALGRSNPLLSAAAGRELYAPPKGSEYACGWGLTDRPWGGGTVLTHSGSNTMNYAVIWLAPLRDFGVIAATNQGGDNAAKACDETASLLIRRQLVR
jgi:CubicO group peptidase (beta-lactamase class C family)